MMTEADRLTAREKTRLRLLFLAKHALSSGEPDAIDGNHAVYHQELLKTLLSLGLDVTAANSFEGILSAPEVDFVIPLLNRAGFQNSEMLAPLLLTMHKVPYLGAAPILRGLADDKHLMKLVARAAGIPVAPWIVVRQGQKITDPPFATDRLVVKPNASSASWGVRIVDDTEAARAHVQTLLSLGHDVIIEKYLHGFDVAVPVVGRFEALILPMLSFKPPANGVRTYEDKRGFTGAEHDRLERINDPSLVRQLEEFTCSLVKELWPFDYGRFEYRLDPQNGDLHFLEVNLSCNLWSKKTMSRSAELAGYSHADLVEMIITHSMRRQGVLQRETG